jgi:hypothetical protein
LAGPNVENRVFSRAFFPAMVGRIYISDQPWPGKGGPPRTVAEEPSRTVAAEPSPRNRREPSRRNRREPSRRNRREPWQLKALLMPLMRLCPSPDRVN